MTRDEAIREVCSIVALAYHSIGNYSQPSDGFCDMCPSGKHGAWSYQNAGRAIDYVRRAVVLLLHSDGHSIPDGFDPVTGKECEEVSR